MEQSLTLLNCFDTLSAWTSLAVCSGHATVPLSSVLRSLQLSANGGRKTLAHTRTLGSRILGRGCVIRGDGRISGITGTHVLPQVTDITTCWTNEAYKCLRSPYYFTNLEARQFVN